MGQVKVAGRGRGQGRATPSGVQGPFCAGPLLAMSGGATRGRARNVVRI